MKTKSEAIKELKEKFWPKTEWHQHGKVTVEKAIDAEAINIMRNLESFISEVWEAAEQATARTIFDYLVSHATATDGDILFVRLSKKDLARFCILPTETEKEKV